MGSWIFLLLWFASLPVGIVLLYGTCLRLRQPWLAFTICSCGLLGMVFGWWYLLYLFSEPSTDPWADIIPWWILPVHSLPLCVPFAVSLGVAAAARVARRNKDTGSSV
jgi:hypothetical protein